MARRKKRSPFRPLLWVAAGVALFGLGALLGNRLLDRTPKAPSVGAAKPGARTAAPSPRANEKAPKAKGEGGPSAEAAGTGTGVPPGAPTPLTTQERPPARLAILFDDLGESVAMLDTIAALGGPFSYAVLPNSSRAREVAYAVSARGGELLVHLPMEAEGNEDPGPGALEVTMSKRAVRRATEQALEAVPGAVGVNNHMGSRFSTDRPGMAAMLEVLAKHGLFFVDSRTTPGSVGFELARDAGIPTAARDVFLDPELGEAAIRSEFARLLELARERGAAIGIAHPHAVTLKVLAEELPRARARGFELVPVSFLLERSEELE